jgi:hypothetical protein
MQNTEGMGSREHVTCSDNSISNSECLSSQETITSESECGNRSGTQIGITNEKNKELEDISEKERIQDCCHPNSVDTRLEVARDLMLEALQTVISKRSRQTLSSVENLVSDSSSDDNVTSKNLGNEDFLPNVTKLEDVPQEEDSFAESSLCEVPGGAESQEEVLESNDRSDGSDSGLGSDVAEERGVPADSLSSGSADESGSTTAAVGQADSEEGAVSSSSDSEAHFLEGIQDSLSETSRDLARSVNALEIPADVLETNSDVVGTLSENHQIISANTLSNFEHSEFATVSLKKKLSLHREPSESFFELSGISTSETSDVHQATMGLNYSLSQSRSSAEEDADLGSILDSTSESQRLSSQSSLKRRLPYDEQAGPQSKRKKTIAFDKVTVFYFPRAQGFTCVPSQGGSTLGMASQHAHVQHFSILEHAVEQRRLHRQVSKIVACMCCSD